MEIKRKARVLEVNIDRLVLGAQVRNVNTLTMIMLDASEQVVKIGLTPGEARELFTSLSGEPYKARTVTITIEVAL